MMTNFKCPLIISKYLLHKSLISSWKSNFVASPSAQRNVASGNNHYAQRNSVWKP